MIKKAVSILLSASLLAGLSACGTASSSSAAGVNSSASTASGESAGSSSQSVSLPTISVSVPSGAHTVTGAVVAIGMSAMTIQTDGGQEVSFSHEGVVNMPSLMEGDRVKVTYIGSLDSADVYAVEKA